MLRALRHVSRLIGLSWILIRHDALFFLAYLPGAALLRRPLRFLARRDLGSLRPGERLALALQAMGPSFIKLGQSLATRADLLGEDIARDLARLQDRLPAFAFAEVRATIEAQLGEPAHALYAHIEPEPVAAASIAQVHFATTLEGAKVAVKVLRPGIEAALERDIDFFAWLAEKLEVTVPEARRLKPSETVKVFADFTRGELDLRLEAAAASELAQNCAHDPGFRVPRPDWRRTARRVVTFERVVGMVVSDRERLIAAGHDPDRIMEHAARVFFNQVFRDGFFHGDMHPGNMLIDGRGTVVALDFGIMGRLGLADRRHLARMMLGFLTGDYAAVADTFFKAGFLPPDEDRAAFTQACRAIGEPINGLPLAQISFGRLLGQVLAVAQRFRMTTKPQLFLLQKTIVVSEGVGRMLNPNINMWETAQPLVEAWARRHLGPRAELEQAIQDGLELALTLPGLASKADAALEAALAVRREARAVRRNWIVPLGFGLALGLLLGLF